VFSIDANFVILVALWAFRAKSAHLDSPKRIVDSVVKFFRY
jgi:hypothetical protein